MTVSRFRPVPFGHRLRRIPMLNGVNVKQRAVQIFTFMIGAVHE